MDPFDVLDRPADGPDLVVRYAGHADGLVDVFLPPALGRPQRPAQLVFCVHGGFWRQRWDRRHVRPLAETLARRGLAVAVPEYRRVGGLGGWPATAYDVRDALAAAPGLVEAAAPGRIDPVGPVVVTGHSAGGHLALWAGLQADPDAVSRIVALAPVSDPRAAALAGMGDGAAQALLGGEPGDVPEHYAEADVPSLLPGLVPVTVIQGTEDKDVAVEMNRQVAAAVGDAEHFRYVELVGVDHFALIDPLSDAFESSVWPALTG